MGGVKARPFVRWSGGKTRLIPELLKRVPAEFSVYHEPFVGSGALFWALAEAGKLDGKTVYLNDANTSLMDAWRGVRDDVERVILALQKYQELHSPEFYKQARKKGPKTDLSYHVAAWVIYLNKTAFNGLWRVNSKGVFNTPIDRTKTKDAILDMENLRACSQVLNRLDVRFSADSFIGYAPTDAMFNQRGFIYLDPPYLPTSKTSSFTGFTAKGFSEPDQRILAGVAHELRRNGCSVLVSQSNVPLAHELYEGFKIEEVWTKRSIAAKKESRGACSELLISSRGG